jgi:diguanylate cyclase (GGDEF)-like protein
LLWDAPRALGQEYVFRAYRQTSGLENLAVNSIAADHQGFLWVATENGIYRFLGSGFQRFDAAQGIADPYITQVFVATDGTLWAASDQNLYRWGGQVFEAAAAQPIKMRHASSLASDGAGSLLVITLGKLYHLQYGLDGGDPASARLEPFFSPDQIAAHPSLDHLGALAALPDGTIWMACANMLCSWKPNIRSGVKSSLQDGVLTEWAEPQGVPPELYRSILQDREGALWAVSLKHIVALLPGTSNQPHTAFVDRSLPQTAGNGAFSRLPIACDPMGRVVVSMPGGIARWDGSGWQTIGKANGLNSTHFTALLFDERGNLWMGAMGNGLYHWVGYADWQGWIDNQGLPSSDIWSIGPFSGGRVWIGTEKGLAILDTHSGLVTEPRFAKDWPYGQVTGIISAPNDLAPSGNFDANGDPAGGTLLIATLPGKVLKVEGHPSRVTLIADLQDYIYRFLRDPSGRTFLIADSGIFDVSRIFDKRSPPLPESRLSRLSPLPQIHALLGPRTSTNQACLSPDGAVWFLGDNGFVRLAHEANRDVWSRPSLRGFPNPLPRLTGMACSKDGDLWVAAGAATIWRAAYSPAPKTSGNAKSSPAPKTETGSISGHLTATQLVFPKAFQSVAVVDLLSDARGWLWIGTDDGVLAWNGSSWRRFTQEDGLIWNDINDSMMTNGPDGSIWVATSGGLSRILHPERMFATPLLRIAIIEARIGERLLPLEGACKLPWSRQDMSFQFAAPDSINRAGLRFHYRLAGLQPDWIESRDQTAHFQTLPPGEYSFEVYAQDSVSGTHSVTTAYRFRVMPPWWRTWWLYTLCGIACCLVMAWIFRLRTRKLLAQQRRLEGMVLERTSELEASREELRRQATHDGLTGLLDRLAVLEAFDQELARARRDGTPLTLVLADIDHFKQINDSYGHLAGDEALRRFSAALAGRVRTYDHVGRYGGEEFLLVLVGIDSGDSVGVKSAGIQERLAALHKSISGLNVKYDGAEFVITCSLGIVQLDDLQGGGDQKLALAAADEALYEAKRGGRNRLIFGHLASGTIR